MKRFFNKLWDGLTRPSPAIPDVQGRSEAQLLASLLLMFVPLWLAATLVPCIAGRCALRENIWMMLSGVATWTLTYGLTRSRYYRFGTLLCAGVAVLLIPMMAFQMGNGLALAYLLLPVLFSGLVFSMRATYLVAGGCLLVLVLMYWLWPTRIAWTNLVSAGTLIATGGMLVLLLVGHRNHTEALRRQELAEQEARYRAVVADQTELIWRSQPDTTLTFVNDALCRFLGVSSEALIGRHAGSWLAEEEREELLEGLATLSPEVPTSECEVRAVRADGHVRWLHGANRAILDAAGAIVEIQTVVRDVTDRVQAEAALAESERRFRSIFEQAPVGIYRTTPDGHILMANPALVTMLGYESYEALAMRDLAADGFGLATPRGAFQVQLEAGGSVSSVESEWARSDGSRIHVRETARLITDSDDQPRYYEGVALDVTAERAAQAQLEAQADFLATLNAITHAALEATELDEVVQVIADRLRETFAADNCYITRWDAERRHIVPTAASGEWRGRYEHQSTINVETPTLTAAVLTANHALAIEDNRNTPYLDPEITGMYSDRSLLGLPFIAGEQKLGAALLGFVERRSFTDDEIARGEQIASHIALAMRNALLYREVRSYASELEARVAHRTTELSLERARLQAVLDSTVEGIVVADESGEVTEANRAAEAWLTRTLSHEEARSLREAIHTIVGSADRRAPLSLSLQELDLQLTSAPIVSETRPDASVVSIYDVTHIKAMDRMRAAFIQNISHELRTPVATLKLYMHLLSTTSGEHRKAYEHAIEEEVNRLSQLVEDVMVLSALDTGQLALRSQETDLVQVVADCCAAAHSLVEKARLTLDVRVEPDPPTVWADPKHLGEAVMQILRNAIAYTPPGGCVTVSTALQQTEEREWVTLNIRDTGPGIPADEIPHLFDRFTRGAAALATQATGTGLGLAITKALVALYGGRLTVESTVGEGSVFTIWLIQAKTIATA